DYDIHIHVVHHIKKLLNEGTVPGKFDAKGSGAITDQVDNMLIHWRNKPKEIALQTGDKNYNPTDPDAMLICTKQRNGEWEGRIQLWLDSKTNQFLAHQNDRPVNFESWPHVAWA